MNYRHGIQLEILTNEEERRLEAASGGQDIKIKKPGFLADLKARKKFLDEKNLGKICKNHFFLGTFPGLPGWGSPGSLTWEPGAWAASV